MGMPAVRSQPETRGGRQASRWARRPRPQVLAADPDAALKEPGAAPGPLAELDFWADRSAQLNSIWEQLCREGVQAVVRALEGARSTFAAPFARWALGGRGWTGWRGSMDGCAWQRGCGLGVGGQVKALKQ